MRPTLTSIEDKDHTFLPETYHVSHDLCFIIHDILAQMLRSGEKHKIFHMRIRFRNDREHDDFHEAPDILTWLRQHQRDDEYKETIIRTVFPAVLSDMLHFIYEALECSRKAKLNVTYALLRKPIQESLFLMEAIVRDRAGFAQQLALDPTKLHSQNQGGLAPHVERISAVLGIIGESRRFNADYLAGLRYNKSIDDGFDGICNKAVHLFTGHKFIRTETLNINFIFSDWDSKLSQWGYLYSRLPYILVYTHSIVEHVCSTIAATQAEYTLDMLRRISALMLLWWKTVEAPYVNEDLSRLVEDTRNWLDAHCQARQCPPPTYSDLERMARTGALPNESESDVQARLRGYSGNSS